MGRPPSIPGEKKTRIMTSVSAGELSVTAPAPLAGTATYPKPAPHDGIASDRHDAGPDIS